MKISENWLIEWLIKLKNERKKTKLNSVPLDFSVASGIY